MTPESAALLVGFLNTVHLPDGCDGLGGSGPADWIADGRLDSGRSLAETTPVAATEPDTSLVKLRILREALRVLTRPGADAVQAHREVLNQARTTLLAIPLTLRLPDLDHAFPRLVPAMVPARGLEEDVATVAEAYLRSTIEGTFARVKTCALPECQWAFYDTSRNRSRRWCAMDGCGNRVKNRNYRARRALRP